MPTIREKLDALVKFYGSQNRLAVELGCSPNVVSWWFTDTHVPSRMSQDMIDRLYEELPEGKEE